VLSVCAESPGFGTIKNSQSNQSGIQSEDNEKTSLSTVKRAQDLVRGDHVKVWQAGGRNDKSRGRTKGQPVRMGGKPERQPGA